MDRHEETLKYEETLYEEGKKERKRKGFWRKGGCDVKKERR